MAIRLPALCNMLVALGLWHGGLAVAPAHAQASAPGFIDVHVHLAAGRGSNADYHGAVEEALKHMDRFGIRTAIILPPPQVGENNWYDYPDFVDALQRYPGRFAFLGGGGRLNSQLHRYAEPSSVTQEVKQAFAEAAAGVIAAGAVGFGEIASLHISHMPGHPFEYVPADHPLLLLLADVAARLDVPIDLHMDAVAEKSPTPTRYAGDHNPPELPATIGGLRRLLAHNGKARIVWAHGGSDPLGAMTAATISDLMDDYPNLYLSLRVVGDRAPVANKLFAHGRLESRWLALLKRHPDRFVIGTDSFFAPPHLKGTGPGVEFSKRNAPKFKATRHFLSLLPATLARKVAVENAVRIYRVRGAGPD
ncbi:MAG: amidohydrolase family protein [Arenicellales bacterium]|nr:amidohydrolase family protein [Arenicellales bacterium]MDP6947714.1 amidohydrolase family protein [Arenicellales bacterium]